MTNVRSAVERMERLVEKATQGPWKAWDRGIGWEVHRADDVELNCGFRETFSEGDAAFIAAARTDVPALLSYIRAGAGKAVGEEVMEAARRIVEACNRRDALKVEKEKHHAEYIDWCHYADLAIDHGGEQVARALLSLAGEGK